MGVSKQLQGPRLPYVVVPLEGKIAVTKYRYDRRTGKKEAYEAEEDAGWIVLFPQGHWLRIRRAEDLRRYKLNLKPKPIAADGMQLHPTQKPEDTYENMRAAVAEFVRMKSGTIAIPGYTGKINLPKRVEEEVYA